MPLTPQHLATLVLDKQKKMEYIIPHLHSWLWKNLELDDK